MAIVFTEGWDHYHDPMYPGNTQHWDFPGLAGWSRGAGQLAPPRKGHRGMCWETYSGEGNYAERILPTDMTSIIIHAWAKLRLNGRRILSFMDAGDAPLCTLWVLTTGQLEWRAGMDAAGTVIATTNTLRVFEEQVWSAFQFYLQFDNTAGAINSFIKDTDQTGSWINLNTRNGAGLARKIRLWAEGFTFGVNYLDDFIVLDRAAGPLNWLFPRPRRLFSLTPQRNGALNEGVLVSERSHTENWEGVGHAPRVQHPDGKVSYVALPIPNKRELYGLGPGLPPNIVEIDAIVRSSLVQLETTGEAGSVFQITNSGTIPTEEEMKPPVSAWGWHRRIMVQNPEGPAPWLRGKVNALEVGFRRS